MVFEKMFGNKLLQFRSSCFKRMSEVCRVGIELGQLGQVSLLTTPVQALCTHESKYTWLFCPSEVYLSPFNPSAIAESVQPEKSGLSYPSPLPPSTANSPRLWAHSFHLFSYLYSPHFSILATITFKVPFINQRDACTCGKWWHRKTKPEVCNGILIPISQELKPTFIIHLIC